MLYRSAYMARIFFHPSGLMLHDFAFFWGGAKLFWLGKVAWVFDPENFNTWLSGYIAPGSMQLYATWSYPPSMLLALLPFGLLPLPIALISWLIFIHALLCLGLHYTRMGLWVTAAVALSPAALYSVSYGQNGALTAALLIAGVWTVDRRPMCAGICIGALIIKATVSFAASIRVNFRSALACLS